MLIRRLYTTPLEVIEMGINTCWDKHNNCIPGKPDKDKIHRIIKKFKHGSTAEHGRTIFKIRSKNDDYLLNILRDNKFTNVTYESQDSYIVSTNLRAIIEANIFTNIKKEMLSEEYHFLLEENEDV